MDNAEQEAREPQPSGCRVFYRDPEQGNRWRVKYLTSIPTRFDDYPFARVEYMYTAKQIAHVRQQAERAALEKAIVECGKVMSRAKTKQEQRAVFDCGYSIRALMQPEQKGKV